MSEVTKSARAVPKCKGCGQPRKGHVGPTGVTKCQNIVDKISEMSLDEVEERNAITCDLKELKKNEEKTHEGVPPRLEDPELDSLNNAKFVLGDVISAVISGACLGTEKDDSDEVLRPGRKTDSNLESARAVPKCKGCGQPRKGHNGPTGLTKCQNIPNVIADNINVSELITDPQELKKAEKTVEDISDYLDSRTSQDRSQIDSLSIATSTQKTTPNKLRISSVCDYENFLSESAMEDLDEVLRPEKKMESGVERVGSISEDLDIRNVLREKTFLLCGCQKLPLGECVCKAVLDFNVEMEATLVDVFDFAQNIICKKFSWKKKSPNELSFILECTPAGSAGKSSVKGTVNLKACRLVTLVKGKKHLSIVVKADIQVKKNNFNKVFQLIEQELVEGEEGDSEDEDEEDTSSEDEVPSEDSDSEVFINKAQYDEAKK